MHGLISEILNNTCGHKIAFITNMNLAISLISNNGKFSYSQTGEMYSKVLSYQVKR